MHYVVPIELLIYNIISFQLYQNILQADSEMHVQQLGKSNHYMETSFMADGCIKTPSPFIIGKDVLYEQLCNLSPNMCNGS